VTVEAPSRLCGRQVHRLSRDLVVARGVWCRGSWSARWRRFRRAIPPRVARSRGLRVRPGAAAALRGVRAISSCCGP